MMKKIIDQKIILRLLIDNSNISVKRISQKISLSEKVTRTRVNQLDQYLKDNNLGKLNKIPSKGISLEINKKRETDFYLFADNNEISTQMSQTLEDEIWRILLLQRKNDNITQLALAQKLFVSLPTLRKAFKKINQQIKSYHLTIVAVQNKGINLTGSIYSKRLAIRDLILNAGTSNTYQQLKIFSPGLDIETIKVLIEKSEMNWKIQFSKDSFNRIWIMTCLSLCNRGNIDSSIDNGVEAVESYNEYNFAESLYTLLSRQGYSSFTSIDKTILAYEILGSSKLTWQGENQSITVKTQYATLSTFVKQLISEISDILDENLNDDNSLKNDLVEHLRSAIFRMKYSSENHVGIGRELKKKYNRIFLSVWSTSQLFEEYYDIQVTENELSYIALYIETALLRRSKYHKALFITHQSRSQSQFVAELIKRNVAEIQSVEIIRKDDSIPNQESNRLVISDFESHSKNIVRVNRIPITQDFINIHQALSVLNKKSVLKNGFSKIIKPLFDPSLFFLQLNIEDKSALLKLMIDELEKLGSVTQCFYQTVCNRENKTSTCIGNSAAIPHGLMTEVNEPRIAVASLIKPIDWFNGEKVDTVFLIAIKMNTELNIKRTKTFYTDLIGLTENKTALADFKEKKNGVEGYNYLFN